ncbi:MAG TPA: TIR domain-containing protein [Pyrinomonadaceae bacterium]|nr:TIR domain-containing protein [Pyrinomonadaceae bacterium]
MSQEQETSWDVFVSYNKAQKEWVRESVRQWRDLGITVFFDEDSIRVGEDFSRGIERGILNSKRVVLIITPSSARSDWVGFEATLAIHSDPAAQAEKIIPVILEPTEDEDIRPIIRNRNNIKLYERREENYNKLLETLGIDESKWPRLSKSFQINKWGRALAIGAHWDDILLGCLGTLLKLKYLYGYEVTLFTICTNYRDKYYGVKQENLEKKAEDIVKAICKRHEFKCLFAPQETKAEFRDREFRDNSKNLHTEMWKLAHNLEKNNLIFTPPMDDGHEDHAFIGQLAFSYFRRTYQTILEYEIKKYTEKWFVPNIFVSLDDEAEINGKKVCLADEKVNMLSEVILNCEDKNKIDGADFLFGVESLRARLITKALDYSGDKLIKYGEAFRGRISI